MSTIARSLVPYAVLAVTFCLVLPACGNPAADKPKATVGEAMDTGEEAPQEEALTPDAADAEGTDRQAASAEAPAPSEAADEMAEDEGTASAAAGTTVYELLEGTYVGFAGSKATGTHYGQFPAFDGSVGMQGNDLSTMKINVTFDTTELTTDNSILTNTLKDETWFAIEQHPTAKFVSAKVAPAGEEGAYNISGNLTIRGITKGVTFPASIELDGSMLTAESEFSLDRSAWDLGKGWVSDTVIYDDVAMELYVEAERVDEAVPMPEEAGSLAEPMEQAEEDAAEAAAGAAEGS